MSITNVSSGSRGEFFRDPSLDEGSSCSPDSIDPRIREAMREGFARDVESNIGLLSESVSARKEIDPEFLQILQQDIDNLRSVYDQRRLPHDSHVWSELYRMNIRLQEVAATMRNLAAMRQSASPQSQTVGGAAGNGLPLVGALRSPLDLRSDLPCAINTGLEILHTQGFLVRRTKGTGHCLFSSVAAHLLTEERLVALQKQLPGLQAQGLIHGAGVGSLIEACLLLLRQGVSIETIMNNRERYDAWVKFLRAASVNWWRREMRNSPERCVHLANAARESIPSLCHTDDNREACENYLQRMTSMEDARYGGEPEMFALSSILGLTIRAIDVKALGQETIGSGGVSKILPLSALPSDIWLLYRGSHFDALYLPRQLLQSETGS